MRILRSLRVRLLVGAFLWTIGLFSATLLLTTIAMLRIATLPRTMHMAAYSHAWIFGVAALVAMAIGFWLFHGSMGPFQVLRGRLAAVRDGRERTVEGHYPSEVEPLVHDLNALLDHRERAVSRALAKAGDLAHGLKTPLAVLAQEADRADAAGQPELAATIRQQVDRMQRHVEYHLAHARAAASGASAGASASVAASSEALARTLLRLHAGRGLTIDQQVDSGHAVRCGRADLDEMLGNLLDNACKYATSRVRIDSARLDGAVRVTVSDDGPGLPDSLREAVLQRGVRADEAGPGSGLGLAIVRDLAEVYGGTITLTRSAGLGGLEASLELPATTTADR